MMKMSEEKIAVNEGEFVQFYQKGYKTVSIMLEISEIDYTIVTKNIKIMMNSNN